MASGDRPFVGITALMDFVLNEGIDGVLDNLTRRAGATAVAINPTVTAPADEQTGSWQPPTDAGASPRVFDRPLWGQRALWVRGGPSYYPREELYQETSYGPRSPNELTDAHGHLVGELIAAAQGRGLRVYFQIGAAQPPGLLEEDVPRLPDGRLPAGRMAHTASLASEAVRAYNRAYLRDLLAAYPEVDGIRVDWPEYPCYTIDEVFANFGPAAEAWAAEHGYDFESIRGAVGELYDKILGGLEDDDLARLLDLDIGYYPAALALTRSRGTAAWLALKADLSEDLLRDWRAALDAAGGQDKELSANAFAPPYTILTGLDFGRAARHCGSISPKLYTMHWALMIKFWGERLLDANPGLDEQLLVRVLVRLMDVADVQGGQWLAHYAYPRPDQAHPIADDPQIRKLNQAVAAADGRAKIYALVHGYGPLDDFRRRVELVARSRVDGLWVNRYGYLSDQKLDAIGAVAGRIGR